MERILVLEPSQLNLKFQLITFSLTLAKMLNLSVSQFINLSNNMPYTSSHSYSFSPTPKETELHLTYYLPALCQCHTFIYSVYSGHLLSERC